MRLTIPAVCLTTLFTLALTPALLADTVIFNSTTAGTDQVTITTTGTYSIQVEGAAGGNSTAAGSQTGGTGANLTGDVTLTAGEVLDIAIGALGTNSTSESSGGSTGGGGTYVAIAGTPNTLLIDAGGGGGAGELYSGGNAMTGNNTAAGTGSGEFGSGGSGGTNGANGGSDTYGKGGNGYLSGNENGGASTSSSQGGNEEGGGGGGGYSGGGGGSVVGGGGGGSSYWNTADISTVTTGSGNTSAGSVTIDLVQAAPTPEPPSLILMATGVLFLAGAALLRRRHLQA